MSSDKQSTRQPVARALVVGAPACRPAMVQALQEQGYSCTQVDDPYAAMAELCRRPLVYRAVVLSLSGIYPEELEIVATVRRRFGHLRIWLAQTDGRAAALAKALRLGADGLLAEDGVHPLDQAPVQAPQPFAPRPAPAAPLPAPRCTPRPVPPARQVQPAESWPAESEPSAEPVLTADELRALLQEPPLRPGASHED